MKIRYIAWARPRNVFWAIAALVLGYVVCITISNYVTLPGVTYPTTPAVAGPTPDIPLAGVATFVNKERAKVQQPALVRSDLLDEAAQAKCADMVAKDYTGHNDPSGKEPWRFIIQTGYSYRYAGENLAVGFKDAHGVVRSWMSNVEYQANVINSYFNEVGYGECKYPPTSKQGAQTLIVQLIVQKS